MVRMRAAYCTAGAIRAHSAIEQAYAATHLYPVAKPQKRRASNR
ncbi:MAG: hypothetical protein R3C68_05095 [Myxococcota bacterium]